MQSIETLVVTMGAKDFDLVNRMNIHGAAVISNQDDRFQMCCCAENERIKMYTTTDRGVGKNRNMGLLHADADICVLADDDMTFDDEYETTVQDAFSKLPQADIIIFNLDTVGEVTRSRRNNSKISRVHIFNVMNYGAGRVTFRRESIFKANLFFSLLFGGGCQYGSGEDTLFLTSALKKGLKIYTFPKRLATVKQAESTWFHGYSEKYLMDKGALYYCLSSKWWFLFCWHDAVRHCNIYKRTLRECLHLMKCGKERFQSNMGSLTEGNLNNEWRASPCDFQ